MISYFLSAERYGSLFMIVASRGLTAMKTAKVYIYTPQLIYFLVLLLCDNKGRNPTTRDEFISIFTLSSI
jgi:hypothetical protein